MTKIIILALAAIIASSATASAANFQEATIQDGKLYKGMVLKINNHSYEAVVVEEEIIKQITINESNMWRMREIN